MTYINYRKLGNERDIALAMLKENLGRPTQNPDQARSLRDYGDDLRQAYQEAVTFGDTREFDGLFEGLVSFIVDVNCPDFPRKCAETSKKAEEILGSARIFPN